MEKNRLRVKGTDVGNGGTRKGQGGKDEKRGIME
jgi:hypothetical protein